MAPWGGSTRIPIPAIPRAEDIKEAIEPHIKEEHRRILRSAKADLLGIFGEYEKQGEILQPEIHRYIEEGRGKGPDAITVTKSKR